MGGLGKRAEAGSPHDAHLLQVNATGYLHMGMGLCGLL